MFKYEIIYENTNENNDKIYHFKVPPNELILFGYVLESLEGWAYYTTIDKNNSIFHVEVIKDYVEDFIKLIL